VASGVDGNVGVSSWAIFRLINWQLWLIIWELWGLVAPIVETRLHILPLEFPAGYPRQVLLPTLPGIPYWNSLLSKKKD
jgi:hypothetical protein